MTEESQSVFPFYNDPIVGLVAEKLRNRSDTGYKKYGSLLTRTDLTLADWIDHAQQEVLDAANYLERLKAEIATVSLPLVLGRQTDFENVKEFIRVFEHDAPAKLWVKLIWEEFTELCQGMYGIQLKELVPEVDEILEVMEELISVPEVSIERLDAICDIKYVVNGLGACLGFDVDGADAEVHRSNMTKLGEDGKPIKREDGKIMKGPNYDPPHLERFV